MKKIIDRIVQSPGAPGTHDLWLTEDNELKVYDNGEWKTINGDGSSDSGGGSSASPVLDWLFPGLVGFVDTTDNDWVVDYQSDSGKYVITEDIIPVDGIHDYLMAMVSESIYGYAQRKFTPVLEYNEEYENTQPSFRGIEITLDPSSSDIPYISEMSSYSYNMKAWKGDTAYLIGMNPGD